LLYLQRISWQKYGKGSSARLRKKGRGKENFLNL
jgi:stalled ribosome alternative rescue factor ArfA